MESLRKARMIIVKAQKPIDAERKNIVKPKTT